MSTNEARSRGNSTELEPATNTGVNGGGAPLGNQSSSTKKGVSTLVAEVRGTVSGSDERSRFLGKTPSEGGEGNVKAGDLLRSGELESLNREYAFASALHSPSGDRFEDRGLLGKIRAKCRAKFRQMVVGVLSPYFQAEQNFQANLVRHLNESAKYMDIRDMSNFWELIRKIDYDVQKALDRIERINDEQMGSIRSLERETAERVDRGVISIQDKVARHDASLRTLEGVAKGLESIIARLHQKNMQAEPALSDTPEREESPKGESAPVPDYSYLLLENRFRGSEEAIQAHLQIYPALFSAAEGPVLEIGPGRGELLELFRQAGLRAYGVDIDSAMVEAACAKGLDARLEDGLSHLRSLENESLGGVIAVQVVEHLTQSQLTELFSLCAKKVKKGGKVVFETINPRSMLALSSNYFRDPTHVWPLHPDTLEFAMSLSGLKTCELRFLSPVAKEAQLQEVPIGEYMSPRWTHVAETLNHNFKQLNELLYGYQDYCIIAERA